MRMTTLLLATTALCGPSRAHADLNFDATTVAPDEGRDALPAGWYNVTMDESELKPTQSGTGTYLKLRFNVLDGQYAGRKVYTQINMRNDNPQAVEIGQRQLSAICHAVNVLKLERSEQLHGLPLKVKLKFVPAKGEYSEKNEIQSYKNKDEKVDMAGGDSVGAAAFGAGPAFTAGGTPPAGTAGQPPAQPWAQGAAAGVVGAPAPTATPQPWAGGTPDKPAEAVVENVPVAPPPPPPPAPPPAPATHDPRAAALADGWVQHPSSPPHLYKGDVVKTHAEVDAMYPAPAPVVAAPPPPPPAPPAPPAAPAPSDPAPEAANGASPSDAQAAPPPWAKVKE